MRVVLKTMAIAATLLTGSNWTNETHAADAWQDFNLGYGGGVSGSLYSGSIWGQPFSTTSPCCQDVWDGYCSERHSWLCGGHHGRCAPKRGHHVSRRSQGCACGVSHGYSEAGYHEGETSMEALPMDEPPAMLEPMDEPPMPPMDLPPMDPDA